MRVQAAVAEADKGLVTTVESAEAMLAAVVKCDELGKKGGAWERSLECDCPIAIVVCGTCASIRVCVCVCVCARARSFVHVCVRACVRRVRVAAPEQILSVEKQKETRVTVAPTHEAKAFYLGPQS